MFTQEMKLLMEGLAPGETLRQNCPACGRSKTFTITRKDDGAILWNCYSTNCNIAGSANGVRNVVRTTKQTERKQGKTPFTGELRELNDEEKAYLSDKIGFGGGHLATSGVRFAPSEHRYAFPIYAPTGVRRGWVLRAYGCDDIRRKALTRLDREEPHLSWYSGARFSNHVLVVEDIPSAVRATVHYPGWCVAMCGGGIGPDYVRELTAYAKHIVWAFDEDATASAIRHHRTYGLCFESSRVLPLSRDLKDMEDSELKEVLSHVVS